MQGPAGSPGAAGQSGLNGLNGLTGPQGLQGLTGPQGLQGPIGLTGPMGPQGLQGEKGVQGDIGTKGDKGDSGRDGLPGLGLYAVSDGNLYSVYLEDYEAVVSVHGTWWQTVSTSEDYSPVDPSSWDLNATVGFTGYIRETVPGDYLVFTNDNCSGIPLGWLGEARDTEIFNQYRHGISYLNGSAVSLFSKYYRATYLNLASSEIQSYTDNAQTCQVGAPEEYQGNVFGGVKHKIYNLVEIEKPSISFDAVLTTG